VGGGGCDQEPLCAVRAAAGESKVRIVLPQHYANACCTYCTASTLDEQRTASKSTSLHIEKPFASVAPISVCSFHSIIPFSAASSCMLGSSENLEFVKRTPPVTSAHHMPFSCTCIYKANICVQRRQL
jgi:hypothetical protein